MAKTIEKQFFETKYLLKNLLNLIIIDSFSKIGNN